MRTICLHPGRRTPKGTLSRPHQKADETKEEFKRRIAIWKEGTFRPTKKAMSGAARFKLQKSNHRSKVEEKKERRLQVLEIRRDEKVKSDKLRAEKLAKKSSPET